MTLHPLAKKSLITGTFLLALAVLIGAFGAHGLKNMVTPDKLVTFETGVRYHFYHAFGILFLAIIGQNFQAMRLEVSFYAFIAGIFLFSFNCYLYVITGMKVFAMIVPVGGVLFTLGWIVLGIRALKLR
jgi:uncharacterized membrane protein YgdD (TMEM256/DUF423 family)